MPLKKYGVLKGKAMNSRIGSGRSPHYQIHLVSGESEFRVAVNVKSQLYPSELLYLIDENFHHPLTTGLVDLDGGFTFLPSKAGGQALDFIRGNLFDRQRMRALPYNVPGPDNDLNEKIDAFVQRAIDDEQSTIFAFGERWGPETQERDKYFGFLPGNGIHDIHMNQGNVDRFINDDGVWQDGGMLIHFPSFIDADGNTRFPEQWIGIFLAFQSQSWHTDDQTGHRLPKEPPNETEGSGNIRIVAALVNPQQTDVGRESVTLLNTSPASIDLSSWSIVDKNKRKSTLKRTMLAPGACHIERLTGEGAQLSNQGGLITLLDPQGLKVDGVSYTREDAKRQGWTLVFR